MYDTLSPVRSPDRDWLEFPVPALPESGARLSLADRASLRLGWWLLLRSHRRVRRNAAHEEHFRHFANERARLTREIAASQEQLLWTVRA